MGGGRSKWDAAVDSLPAGLLSKCLCPCKATAVADAVLAAVWLAEREHTGEKRNHALPNNHFLHFHVYSCSGVQFNCLLLLSLPAQSVHLPHFFPTTFSLHLRTASEHTHSAELTACTICTVPPDWIIAAMAGLQGRPPQGRRHPRANNILCAARGSVQYQDAHGRSMRRRAVLKRPPQVKASIPGTRLAP